MRMGQWSPKWNFGGLRAAFERTAEATQGSAGATYQSRSGTGTRRTRQNGLIRTVGQRLTGALATGMVIALLVGVTGCSPTPSETASNAPQTELAQVQASDAMTTQQAADLAELLNATKPHAQNLWRDRQPFNADGTLNAYIEIPQGESTKWEYDPATNERVVDRLLHPSLDGYPVNYGFVPQTFAFDSDPFDVLVLGPALDGGTFIRGKIVGIMRMDDEAGRDPKVVISPVDSDGNALYELTTADRAQIGAWFDAYKKPDAHKGKWSKVNGWGEAQEAQRVTDQTHRWFEGGLDALPEIKKLRTE